MFYKLLLRLLTQDTMGEFRGLAWELLLDDKIKEDKRKAGIIIGVWGRDIRNIPG